MSPPSLQSRVEHLDNALHHGGLRDAAVVTMLIWHASEGDESAADTVHYLNTTQDKTASYHYVIDRDGGITRMTNPILVAYHAGDSAWPNPIRATPANPDRPNGGRSVNAISIGICFANNGRNTGEAITDAQRESGLWLAGSLADDYPIARHLGHLEVSPGRKVDPGPSLDMDEWRAAIAAYLEAT